MFSPTAKCIPAVCNMGEGVLPTVRMLSEAAKREREEGADRAKRPLETRTPGPTNMMREVRREGGLCSSRRVRVQLTESAVVVDVDDVCRVGKTHCQLGKAHLTPPWIRVGCQRSIGNDLARHLPSAGS